jgi:hypothetical protein
MASEGIIGYSKSNDTKGLFDLEDRKRKGIGKGKEKERMAGVTLASFLVHRNQNIKSELILSSCRFCLETEI